MPLAKPNRPLDRKTKAAMYEPSFGHWFVCSCTAFLSPAFGLGRRSHAGHAQTRRVLIRMLSKVNLDPSLWEADMLHVPKGVG